MPPGTPGAGEWEVGWRFARHAWGQGYATEAARAARGVALDDLALGWVWSMTTVGNVRSMAVMRRLGLVEHTRFEHPRLPIGHSLRPHMAT
jgi:RimJ/RimL family protein N-acetyltransferase